MDTSSPTQPTETVELSVARIVPWWLWAALVVIASLQIAVLWQQMHSVRAAVERMPAPVPVQCPVTAPAPMPAEIVAAETPAARPARPRHDAQSTAPIQAQPDPAAAQHSTTRWGTTDLDREIAAFPSTTTFLESAK